MAFRMLSGDAADISAFYGSIDGRVCAFHEYSEISRQLKASKSMIKLAPVAEFSCWSYKHTYE
jgi:hypothetical protein